MGFGASRLDVRLVPAALVSWIVTAAGIVWPIGNVCALCCVVVALGGGALWWCGAPVVARSATGFDQRRPGRGRYGGRGVRACGRVALEAVDRHPITVAFGTSALVTVTPARAQCRWGGAG